MSIYIPYHVYKEILQIKRSEQVISIVQYISIAYTAIHQMTVVTVRTDSYVNTTVYIHTYILTYKVHSCKVEHMCEGRPLGQEADTVTAHESCIHALTQPLLSVSSTASSYYRVSFPFFIITLEQTVMNLIRSKKDSNSIIILSVRNSFCYCLYKYVRTVDLYCRHVKQYK